MDCWIHTTQVKKMFDPLLAATANAMLRIKNSTSSVLDKICLTKTKDF